MWWRRSSKHGAGIRPGVPKKLGAIQPTPSTLTSTDGYSPFLLRAKPSSTRVQDAKPVFTRVCKEFGLPQRIRTDNGVPFATNTLARLSQLSAWWVRLGLLTRVHRTRQTATERPPRASASHPESRNHPTARRQPARTAAEVQPLP